MKYEDQSASALNLSLIYGPFNKDGISILSTESFDITNGIVEVGIIGASHFCSVEIGNNTFTEMFACIKRGTYSIENAASIQILESEGYAFTSHIHHFDSEELFIKFIEDFKKSASQEIKVELSFNFETKNELPAVTSVQVSESKSFINIKTIHAYPNEMNIVLTQSQILKLTTKGVINE